MTAEVLSFIDPFYVEEAARKEGVGLSCKFVIIERDDVVHLVFGLLSDYPYHANLIDRFCLEGEIPSGWIKKPDVVEVYDDSVQIRGGGYVVISPGRQTALFSGYSTAYGCYEPSDVKLVTDNHRFFADYSVDIPDS